MSASSAESLTLSSAKPRSDPPENLDPRTNPVINTPYEEPRRPLGARRAWPSHRGAAAKERAAAVARDPAGAHSP